MTKGYVTDADVAAEIRGVAPGSSWADVMAAADAVCRRLGSRDDDKTVAAFKEVLDRAGPTAPMSGDRERAEVFKVGDWVISNELPNHAFKIMDILQGPNEPPRFYYNEDGDAYRANELTPLSSAGRDEEWAKAARELLEAEYRLGDMMSNKNHDLYRAALDNYTTKRDALAALVEGVKG